MAGRVLCNSCGAKVEVPPGYSRAKIRCTTCGYYADVPPELRNLAPEEPEELTPDDDAPAPPPPPRPRSAAPPPPPDLAHWPKRAKKAEPAGEANPYDHEPDRPAAPAAPSDLGPPLLAGSQTEDDDRPYAVPGDGTKACPACNGRLPLAATFCTKCGTDLKSGKKPRKKFTPVDREWEARWPLQYRLIAFAGLQALNVLVAAITGTAAKSPMLALLYLVMQGGLQAFLLGTYEAVRVRRTSKGKTTITKAWRICFVKLPPAEIDWKKHQAVGLIRYHHQGAFEWMVFGYLFCCMAVLPALVFYFVIVHPVRYDLAFCDVHGGTDGTEFRTTNEAAAEDLCETISECTGLMYRRVM